jgi:cytochrome c biogenesis protein CcdA
MAVSILALIILLCTSPFRSIVFNEENNALFNDLKFYAFSDLHCSACVNALETLPRKPIIYDLREFEASKRYSKIMDLTNYTAFGVPLIGVVKDNRLILIASGSFSSDDWKNILTSKYGGVPIYISGRIEPIKIIENEELIDDITKLFIAKDYENSPENTIFSSIAPIAAIITAAFVDSINPCEFYVLTILLSLVFFRAGRKEVLKVGLMYALGIFLSYFFMGFGLVHLLVYSNIARYIIVVMGITIGLRTILNLAFGAFGISIGLRETISGAFGKKFKRIPDAFSTRISFYLKKAASSPLIAFLVGTLSGLLLSPCTSGPYFIALSLIANLQNPFTGLLLLIVYNLIFIIPMLIITLSVYALRITTKSLKKVSSQHYQKIFNLITGLLIILLSIYLLMVSA